MTLPIHAPLPELVALGALVTWLARCVEVRK